MLRRHESLDESLSRLKPDSVLGRLATWRSNQDKLAHHPLGLRSDDFRALGQPGDYSQTVLLTRAATTASRFLWSLEEVRGSGAGFNHTHIEGLRTSFMPPERIEELTQTFDRRLLDGLEMGPILRLTLQLVLANTYPAETSPEAFVPGQSLRLGA